MELSYCEEFVLLVSLVGDGRLGFAESGPYDAIHVGAAAAEVPQAVSFLEMFTHGLCTIA